MKNIALGVINRKSKGNVADIMTMGILVLSMAIIMLCFMDCIKVVKVREDASQIVRKYLLIAETKGGLSIGDKTMIEEELTNAGVSDIDLTGTTFSQVQFGSEVTVNMRGKVDNRYEITESRASTAKY